MVQLYVKVNIECFVRPAHLSVAEARVAKARLQGWSCLIETIFMESYGELVMKPFTGDKVCVIKEYMFCLIKSHTKLIFFSDFLQ